MSTLTDSPAISPRSSFHVQRSPYSKYAFSSGTTAPSPKSRSSHASPVQAVPGSSAGARQQRAQYVESPAIEKASRYVSEGTQYSPEGYPPTARTTLAGANRDSTTRAGKRKERATSPMPMSTPSSSSASTSAVHSHFPPEPDPRRDPTPIGPRTSQSTISQATTLVNTASEAQEARSTHGHSSTPKRSRQQPGQVVVMPLLYQRCNPKHLGVLIANMLLELIRINDQIPLHDGKLTRFHSRAPPGISVSDYLQRLIHHATLSPPILLSMVYYIDRLCAEYPAFTITSLTVHRFLITAATVAAKGLSDSFWTNPTYAKIGGIPATELATLELEFLKKVKWLVVPKPEVLVEYYEGLVDRTEGYVLERTDSDSSGSGSTSIESSEDEEEKESSAKSSSDKDAGGDEIMKDEPT